MSSLEPVRAGDAGDTTGFLAGLDEDEIATVLGYTEARRYAAGELAIRRGDADRSLFIITAGAFEVLVPTPWNLSNTARAGCLQKQGSVSLRRSSWPIARA